MPSTNRRPQPARGRAGAQPAGRRLPLLPIVAGLIAVAAVVAVVASLGGDDDTGDAAGEAGLEQTRPVSVSGEPLPELGEGTDAAIGTQAPDLSGASFDGSPVTIGDDGSPKLLVFLAHWCPHCQREVPVIVDWLAEGGQPESLDFYAIATGTSSDRPNYPPSEWIEEEGLDVPTLADDEDFTAAQAFGLSAYPYFVAIDAEGRVVLRGSGELEPAQLDQLAELATTTSSAG